MGLVKAKLILEDNTNIEVQFNPAEYNISEGANYADKNVPGLDGPITQYISGTAQTLNMTLIFDTYEPPEVLKLSESGTDVTKKTQKIVELTYIKGDLHRPPVVTFSWSSLSFKGVITDVKQSFTMFLSDGMPVRAKLDVTFKSVFDITKAKRKSPFESPDRTKFRTVHEGEQLWNFAYKEYGSAKMWRVIAKENGIMNPLDISPGQIIKLPAI
ncbi:MAG TPA: LysM peptidoglycan-binding domain-containing protein [Clostridiales bacterium]|nr:LysM peptidoglycan-binding domain-containing protein [Clostridiales bacterium]